MRDVDVDTEFTSEIAGPARQLMSMFREALTNIDSAVACVEKAEEPLIDLLAWGRHFRDVLNMALGLHRAMVLHGITAKMPETTRHMILPSLTMVRKDLLPFTPLDDSCLNAVTLAIMSSIGFAIRLLRIMGPNRWSIGIVRLTAMLSRAKTRGGMYLEKESIIAFLHELRDNVSAAAMVLTSLLGE